MGAMELSLNSLDLLQVPIAIALIASGIFYLIEIYSARQFFRSRPPLRPTYQPGVSILKPLKGLDLGLYENLTSICRQEYPSFQLICGVADAQDPAAAVV